MVLVTGTSVILVVILVLLVVVIVVLVGLACCLGQVLFLGLVFVFAVLEMLMFLVTDELSS